MRILLLTVILFFVHTAAAVADDTQWVNLGTSDIDWGYITPYQLQLQAPYGHHDIEDIRAGMQVVRFRLKWLSPTTTKEYVASHFKHLIESKLSDAEAVKFNQAIIDKFLAKLPATQRNDVWYFTFSPDQGTEFSIANKLQHTLIGAEVNRALYHGWLYHHPVTTALLLKRLNRHRQQQ